MIQTHLRPEDYRVMPWKNGGGSTQEIVVEPPGADLERGFAWRLSTAEVATSGPFSAFPGLQRTLLLLEGDGFRLDFGDRGLVELRESLEPVVFAGDWPASAALLGGPCKDFNLMADPARCSAALNVVHLDRTRRQKVEAPTLVIFLAKGTLCVPEWGLQLGQHHTLRVEGGNGTFHMVPGYGGAALVVIEIQPV